MTNRDLRRVLLESAVAQVASAERLQEIARIADELADAREEAFYGTEETSAAELFTRDDAIDALRKGQLVEGFVKELAERYIRIGTCRSKKDGAGVAQGQDG